MSVFTHTALERGGKGYEMEETKKTKFDQYFQYVAVILSSVAFIITMLTFIEVKTDFLYKASVGANLVKAGVLVAKPATIESLPEDFGKENYFTISAKENVNIVYLEYKIVVFYKSNGSLYYFGIPYILESGQMSILWPGDYRKDGGVEQINLGFSKYDFDRHLADNISDNLAEVSIIYNGHSE